jgi:23S rRNA (uracil1939-C5)-methyltransferase
MSKDEIEVVLSKMVYGGEAIGRLADGRAVFVPFALPGERVQIRLVEEKRSYARAELIQVLEPAAERIEPRCKHFAQCGGCHYQHVPYAMQLTIKEAIVKDQLERVGGLVNPPVQPMRPSPKEWNYRNHVQFHLDRQGKLGFEAARSNQVIPVQECHLPEESLNQVWPLIDSEPLPGLERVGLRLGKDEDVLLVLENSQDELPEFLVEELPVSAVQTSPNGLTLLAGSDHIVMEVLGRDFYVSPESFFQVNTLQAGSMVESLLSSLLLSKDSILLELYCGVGLFSAFLAPRIKRLVGVEASPIACRDFTINLDEFENVELYEAPVEVVLPALNLQPDILLADPPRSGMGMKVIEAIVGLKPAAIAYVSCDPATLGRDARDLVNGGYVLDQVIPFDLFPQTYHIETMSFWKRDKG